MSLFQEANPSAHTGTGTSVGKASLEDILITHELGTRPSSQPDYEAENKALVTLASHMAESPATLLQKLVEQAMVLCNAGSAGLSLEEMEGEEAVFRWKATCGRMARFLGGTMPRNFSPCSLTLAQGCVQLMRDPGRYYEEAENVGMPLKELLLVPFKRQGKMVGTVWVISHEEDGHFTTENVRILTSLSLFATAALDAQAAAEAQAAAQLKLDEMDFKLEAALAAGSIATWTWDILQNRVFVDSLGARLFSVSEQDAQGGPVEKYLASIHPDDRSHVGILIQQAIDQGDSFEAEYRLTNDDMCRWVLARGKILRNPVGKAVLFPGVLMDITDRKLAELDQEKRQQLESSALRSAHDEAVALSRAKDEFLAALSHELRTPLNPALMLASEAAKNRDYPREARRDFEAVRKNIELEARLIDDLLDITRISNGKFVLYRSVKDLHHILRDAVEKIGANAQEKNISIHWKLNAPDSFVFADPVRLQQVFWNVLKNAVKFTPAGGSIEVESQNSTDGHQILMLFRDSGIGIESNELTSIFDAFAQGRHAIHHHSHIFGGLGLGLAISKKIIEAHSGCISAASPGKDQGATFIIELPTTTLSQLSAEPHPGQKVPGKTQSAFIESDSATKPAPSLRILIVEDHDDTRMILHRLLTRRSHQVQVAANGEEALLVAESHPFDLLLCDIGLPDIDGYSLLREIHKLRPGLPAVAMTGYGMESDQELSAQAGFLAHLTKPVSLAALEDTLRGLALGVYVATESGKS